LALPEWRVLAFKFAEQASLNVVRVWPAANRRIQDRQIAGVGQNQTISDRAHLAAAKGLRHGRLNLVRHAVKRAWRSDHWPHTTPRWASSAPKGRWRDGNHEIGDS
jgi:hypothetical protein